MSSYMLALKQQSTQSINHRVRLFIFFFRIDFLCMIARYVARCDSLGKLSLREVELHSVHRRSKPTLRSADPDSQRSDSEAPQ